MRRPPVRSFAIVLVALGLAATFSACSSDRPTSASEHIVAAQGGSATLADEVVLRIPAGALQDDTTITITRESDESPALGELEGGEPVGDSFNIDLGGQELTKPVALEIAYDPGRLLENGPEDVVFLAFYDEEAEKWIPVGGQVDQERRVVIVETNRLSLWKPWEWNWDAWIAVLKKTLSLKLSNWIDAVRLLAGDCAVSGEHTSVDASRSNKVIQGCIEKDDPSSPQFRVVNLKSFFLGISPAPDGPGYPSPSLLGPGDAARFTASASDTPPAAVYADFTEAAMWRFIVGLAARMLPLGDEIPNEGLAFIAEGLQRVMSAEEVSKALKSGDAAAAAEAVIALMTSDTFIEKFTELAAEYGEKNGLDMMKKWTKAGIKQVFLAVAAADVIFSSTDFLANYFFSNRSEVAFSWATPTPTPTPTPQPHVSEIAYVGPDGNVWVVRTDGAGARRLTTDGRNTSPRWSPDGRRIAFLHRQADDAEVLEVMNVDGSNRTRLTESFSGFPFADYAAELSNVRWSADGCTIYFHVAPGPVSMHPVHAEPLCGGAAADASFAHFFDVRDDGVFARAMAGGGIAGQIEIGLLDDMNPITVLEAYGPVSWSPDGARLALKTGSEIQILDASGRILSSLSTPGLDGSSDFLDQTLDWSPDGQSLVYEAVSGLMIFRIATEEARVLVEGSQPDWAQ